MLAPIDNRQCLELLQDVVLRNEISVILVLLRIVGTSETLEYILYTRKMIPVLLFSHSEQLIW